MVLKRAFQFDDGEDGFGMGGPAAQESKRFRNAVRDVMGRLSVNDFVSRMEPLLRAVVRDEVERTVLRVFQSSSRPSFNQNRTCGGLKLHFVNKLPSTIFTGGRIEAECGNPVRVVLMDANTRAVVSSGPLASLKIEIVPLDADFGFDDEEDWSGGEFAASVIREREVGREVESSGWVLDLCRRSLMKRGSGKDGAKLLWLRITAESCIRKHHPPHLGDEVWRLERIAKDGAFNKRLASYGVKSVQDFLQLYMIDPTMLRTVLGCGISNKIWDTIIEHANTCVLDGSKFYSYFDAGQSIGLLFDSVYKVVGAMFDGQNYEALHNLSPAKKALVENVRWQAYKNLNSFIQVDSSNIFGPLRSLTTLPTEPFTRQDQPEMQMDFNNSCSSTSYGYDTEISSPLEVSGAQTSHQEAFHQMFRNSFKFTDFLPLSCTEENSWPPKSWPVATGEQLSREDIPDVQAPTWSPGNSTWGTGSAFVFSAGDEGDPAFFSSYPSFGVHISRIRPPRARWCKLRAALKMGSFMRDLAARRMSQGLCM
ncbi:hypothetical protein OIU85_005181 [Salix viminalis]|uniref:Uncharacterized protein n=1 Tax=Salix viminalis TaxID=40686 RepID=A0A9Q0SYY3_SALVM|nr:hypothetical protein OIU85_005181 [Salix viminalis]